MNFYSFDGGGSVVCAGYIKCGCSSSRKPPENTSDIHVSRNAPSRYAPRLFRSKCTNVPLTKSLDTQFWTNIYLLEIPSSECLSTVRSLLTCPAKITAARGFQGNEAQKLIEFLDRVSQVSSPHLNNSRGLIQVFALAYGSPE